MFKVPFQDKRLKNKDEILAIRFLKDKKIAISVKFLSKNPVYQKENFVVLTDSSSASRVYEVKDDVVFKKSKNDNFIIDQNNKTWEVNEDYITSKEGKKFKRLGAHRAFWFGWHAANPNTELIQ